MLKNNLVKSAVLVIISLFFAYNSLASCSSPQANDCSFYRKCVQSKFHCSDTEYPIGYGEKYCNKFNNLSSSNLSSYGVLWRNETLICLQQSLVPTLNSNSSINTCSELEELAFDSHPGCYTNVYMSICELPISDWTTIAGVVDAGDYLSMKSLKQVASVIKTCSGDFILDLKAIDQQLLSKNNKSTFKSNENKYELLQQRQVLIDKLEFIESLD